MLTNLSHDRSADPHKAILFSAGSLSQAFKKVGNEILADQGLCLEVDFGSTARMAKLIHEGSACDVFVAADMTTPQKFVDCGRSNNVIPLVRNDMVAIARKDLGLSTETLRSYLLTAGPSRVGISDPETQPCGTNAIKGLSRVLCEDAVNRTIRIVTGGLGKKKEKAPGEKSDYAVALEKDTDLLLVFRTTARKVCAQLGTVEIIELPPSMAITAQYGMTAMNDTPSVQSLIDYLQTQKVKNIFETCGFKPIL